ncbi:glycerol kinase [Halarsenatibacter silvermanii]|uniref:Glycerol kinase n=1 Tax=Halarsenatibacter silvermanii TaxID=321763 RepID=A0A1G9LIY3_9FIRM|nr:glycerol kinase GlpK [Halarsenatibacter silvermanii]SDL61902.1 glycerol kinase [Halarsenatibacter silvermanii]
MSASYILAIDQGTTSTRAMIFDQKGKIVEKSQQEFQQIYPKSGWVEHDPADIWESTKSVMSAALQQSSLKAENIAGIGITNQRETTMIWDRETGEPVYNAIVWQCRRTTDICAELKDRGLEDIFQQKTGLLLDPYFSGTKVKWILDNIEGVRERAENGELVFGTVDSWLIWRLSGGKEHVTDYTNASRTLMYNIHELEWDEDLLEILDIPASLLPEVQESSSIFARTSPQNFFGYEKPIAGIAGDQHSATFAQACYKKGMIKSTYGTGAFMLMNTGADSYISENGLLTTIGWGLEGEINYCLEGSIFNAGSAVQWLSDELELLSDPADSEYFAQKVDDTDGVYIVPAFTGLGAPQWEPRARGTVVGVSRGTTRNHLIRATLEAVGYQSQDLLEAMYDDTGIECREIRVDGGAASNGFLLQFLADIADTTVQRPVNTETTAAGAAYLAGLAVNLWSDKEEIRGMRRVDKEVHTGDRSSPQGGAYFWLEKSYEIDPGLG